MSGKKSIKKTTSKSAMPRTTTAPPSSRNQHKSTAPRVSAAVSMEASLYRQTIKEKLPAHDNNFSGYVRKLIRKDLGLIA